MEGKKKYMKIGAVGVLLAGAVIGFIKSNGIARDNGREEMRHAVVYDLMDHSRRHRIVGSEEDRIRADELESRAYLLEDADLEEYLSENREKVARVGVSPYRSNASLTRNH